MVAPPHHASLLSAHIRRRHPAPFYKIVALPFHTGNIAQVANWLQMTGHVAAVMLDDEPPPAGCQPDWPAQRRADRTPLDLAIGRIGKKMTSNRSERPVRPLPRPALSRRTCVSRCARWLFSRMIKRAFWGLSRPARAAGPARSGFQADLAGPANRSKKNIHGPVRLQDGKQRPP